MKKINITGITRGALIAGILVILNYIFAPISFNVVQFRVSEILCLLPALFPEAILGMTLGAFLSNLLIGGVGFFDYVFGTLATFFCSILINYLFKRTQNLWLISILPVIFTVFITGTYLAFLFQTPLLLSWLYVGIGEIGAVYLLAVPFTYALKRVMDKRGWK